MKIELSMEEAKALHNLIDIAVRANGVNVAMAAAVLATKIDQAAREELEEQSKQMGRED